MSLNQFLKELLRSIILGSLLFLGTLAFYYFTNELRFDLIVEEVWTEYYGNIIFFIIIYMVNMFWILFFIKKHNSNIYTVRRIAIAISGNIVVSFIGAVVARFIILMFFHKRSFQDVLAAESLYVYLQPVIIAIVISLIFYAIWYYKYRQENKVKEQKIIAGTASAKFDALKNQLDPHFLFNSLNVLTSLIEEDPYQAQKFTTSLSKVYRYVLEQKNKDLVSVDEELQFAKTYVRLLKMRFEDSIVFEIPEKSSDPDAKIIPLSLQLLLENAVKHNVVTSEKPLHLKVSEENGVLIVSNNLQEKQVVKKSSGVGLTNIQQRYGILTDKTVQIRKTAAEFSVELPILTKQISKMETQKMYIEDKRYEKAKEQVEAIKGFYGNLTSYCIVIPILVFINYTSGTSFPWAIFPALGWGFGLTAHGLGAFGYNPLFGKGWEARKMREFIDDDNF